MNLLELCYVSFFPKCLKCVFLRYLEQCPHKDFISLYDAIFLFFIFVSSPFGYTSPIGAPL